MDNIIQLIQKENFLLISTGINILLAILVFVLLIIVIRINRRYIKFMKQLGNGNNIDEMLKKYIEKVREISKDNEEIKAYYTKLEKDIDGCIQKFGIVRFNAFRDVGGDLSFALALLDRENNGIVLNGIYGSESSNIYAKPIKNGVSTYQLSDEEKYAIDLALQSKNNSMKSRDN